MQLADRDDLHQRREGSASLPTAQGGYRTLSSAKWCAAKQEISTALSSQTPKRLTGMQARKPQLPTSASASTFPHEKKEKDSPPAPTYSRAPPPQA